CLPRSRFRNANLKSDRNGSPRRRESTLAVDLQSRCRSWFVHFASLKSGLTIRRREKRISHRHRWRDRRSRSGTIKRSGTEKFSGRKNSRPRFWKVRRKESAVSRRADHRGRTRRKFVRQDRHRILQRGRRNLAKVCAAGAQI